MRNNFVEHTLYEVIRLRPGQARPRELPRRGTAARHCRGRPGALPAREPRHAAAPGARLGSRGRAAPLCAIV